MNERVPLEHPLAVPPLLEFRMENGEKVFSLTAQKGKIRFLTAGTAETAGYNGSYLGPTIRARRGDHVRINVTNELGEPTTIHWHGMHLPAAMDGGPHQPVLPGALWSPDWVVTNEAATLWYHPHTLGKTAPQVYSGLTGLFIVEDEQSTALALPKDYGVDDIPLIVEDRNFDSDGRFIYIRDRAHQNFGQLGQTILVNGTYAPFIDVPKNWSDPDC